MSAEKIKCSCCGKEQNANQYYISESPFNSATGKLSVCKSCLQNEFQKDKDNLKNVQNILRMIDRPFVYDLWVSAVNESESKKKSAGNVLGTYMKNIGMKDYKSKTWADSEFDFEEEQEYTTQLLLAKSTEDISKDDIDELMEFWGRGLDVEDYIWLQNEYIDFTNRYECDSKGMELLINEICLTRLDIRKRRENGEKVDQQQKTLQDLLGSSNLKPVQETGASGVEQESFGTLIKKYENERPIPEPEPRWKDPDKIGKYIKVFFLGHLSRMLGLKNQYSEEYWEEMNKHTVEEPVAEEEDRENDLT
ncbi:MULTISPECIES: hypothetical protein [Bacillus]|uniref:hypothetical protein n=1 Tax=Bacillus TaxID=1386 RepID=UPI001E2B9D22|nr:MULTISPECIES: hypothetical protein [Bacillus]MDR4910638.1 hypothetical protein [Bacillus subtilis]UEG55610.1 hypothetical protein LK685_12190 [Bacillus sp. BC1-43]